ncbi:Uncharacterised protein [uncultured archaeon]|nr:Uncharacterised protein [uncultured archaeon]
MANPYAFVVSLTVVKAVELGKYKVKFITFPDTGKPLSSIKSAVTFMRVFISFQLFVPQFLFGRVKPDAVSALAPVELMSSRIMNLFVAISIFPPIDGGMGKSRILTLLAALPFIVCVVELSL